MNSEVNARGPLAACDQPLVDIAIGIEPENVARCVVIEITNGRDLRAGWVSSGVNAGAPVSIGKQPDVVIAGRSWGRRRRRRWRCAGRSHKATADVEVSYDRAGIVDAEYLRAVSRRIVDCRECPAAIQESMESQVARCVIIADDLARVVDAVCNRPF